MHVILLVVLTDLLPIFISFTAQVTLGTDLCTHPQTATLSMSQLQKCCQPRSAAQGPTQSRVWSRLRNTYRGSRELSVPSMPDECSLLIYKRDEEPLWINHNYRSCIQVSPMTHPLLLTNRS
jgi:hypothetical protein